MGRLLLLLLRLLLGVLICTPASWALICLHCRSNGPCQVETCAAGQDLCRTTVIRVWKVDEELEMVEKGCAHTEKSNRTMSYRMGSEIISLTETVCGSNLCNKPTRTNWRDERHTRGCGFLPGCPGPTSFHNNLTFHYLRCCNSTKCNGGPVIELKNLPPNGVQCYSCEGNSTHGCSSSENSLIDCRGPMNQCLEATGTKGMENKTITVRGCATASWCQDSHMADTFSLTRVSVSCCEGSGCNDPASDIHYRSGGAPQPGPVPLSLASTLLVILRLWGGVFLWT
ncbi:urokinase plasminogen activator surface receptor isoform X4 [Cavia porcellus]|uniref:urokinase plasminogen activator surface receptor isoform X4 n=1 Tax=Cavia porcellus TaxID=10141 RepID=UPI002FE206B1